MISIFGSSDWLWASSDDFSERINDNTVTRNMTFMTKQTYDGSSIQKNKQKQHFEINICFYFDSGLYSVNSKSGSVFDWSIISSSLIGSSVISAFCVGSADCPDAGTTDVFRVFCSV